MGAGQDRPGAARDILAIPRLGITQRNFSGDMRIPNFARARRLENVAPEVSGLHNKAWRQNCFLTPQQETAVNPFDPISWFEHERLLTDRRSVDARLLARSPALGSRQTARSHRDSGITNPRLRLGRDRRRVTLKITEPQVVDLKVALNVGKRFDRIDPCF